MHICSCSIRCSLKEIKHDPDMMWFCHSLLYMWTIKAFEIKGCGSSVPTCVVNMYTLLKAEFLFNHWLCVVASTSTSLLYCTFFANLLHTWWFEANISSLDHFINPDWFLVQFLDNLANLVSLYSQFPFLKSGFLTASLPLTHASLGLCVRSLLDFFPVLLETVHVLQI